MLFPNLLKYVGLIELVVLELSGPHAALKHEIEFFVSPALCLRHAEIAPYEAKRRQPSKEKSQFSAQVGLVRVDHVGNGDGHSNPNQSLHGSRYGDGLAADFCGGALAQDDEADRSNGL